MSPPRTEDSPATVTVDAPCGTAAIAGEFSIGRFNSRPVKNPPLTPDRAWPEASEVGRLRFELELQLLEAG